MATLGDKSVGSIIKLNINGSARDFIVVHQGLPSSMYDSSCNGTWLLMKDIYRKMKWDSSNNDYKNSDIHNYLNSTFLNLFDSNINSAIKQVKIPYVNGTGDSGSVASGSNGLSTKIFLLSGYEVGWTQSVSEEFPIDGAKLNFFLSGTDTTANNKRIANYNGVAMKWWLRSSISRTDLSTCLIGTDGGPSEASCNYSTGFGMRPALILAPSLSVSSDGSVVTNTAPSTPSSITVPSSIMGGSTINISWGASSDSEGNLSGYIVQRSTNGGSWSQIYNGSSRSTTDSVAFGTTSVQYRVKAYDSAGLESGYKTSSQVTVINNTAPTISGSSSSGSNLGEKSAPFNFTYTVRDANNDPVTVKEYLDNVLQRSYTATLGATNTFQTTSNSETFQNISYALHTIKVVATDSEGASSAAYTVTFTKINNLPTITSDKTGDLGTLTDGFTCNYSVNDADAADSVTITLTMDSTVIQTFTATKGTQYTYTLEGNDWLKITNGTHTFKISATDGKDTTTSTATFTRNCARLMTTLSALLPADDSIVACTLKVAGSIPEDAVCKFEVTNNANDTEPVWEDCTEKTKAGLSYIFTNKTAANGFAFNFRISIERGESGTGGYITGVSGGFE